ncbi:3-hydroxyacyl-CoA dehydrogenase NAD-binding domain-containing protein [Advenella mimigardefordensis]|nr:3-hydroxyacyl-CoA dehydrogenase NAD-binding domain-containing protein [Advenella mimigardefordensis]
MATKYTVTDSVAVITIDNPPVNGLGYAVRVGLINDLDRALADEAVLAVVVTGAGKVFCGGADMREFNSPKTGQEPGVNAVIAVLENSSKPVVAAVHGVAMGGGLELAMGCHYRVALKQARVALSEVTMGLLPGAGGTQRLPRLVGLELATDMITTGSSRSAASLADSGLFDKVVDADLLTEAIQFALDKASQPAPYPRVRDRKVEHANAQAYLALVAAGLQARKKHLPAPQRCVEALLAATQLPFDEGLALERRFFLELMATSVSKSLRHAFFSERAATKVPGISDTAQARPVNRVGVVGAGLMGAGIAANFLSAGIPVLLNDRDQESIDRGAATILRNYETSARKGKLTTAQIDQNMALLTPAPDLAALADCDLVIEAAYEDMAVKKDLFHRLDEILKPGAILTSNTSTLDMNEIARTTQRPQDVLGLHFFSPANVMRLLEIVRTDAVSDDVLVTAIEVAKRIGKVPVVSGVCDGFIGNRMLAEYSWQAASLLHQGATPEQIDRALEKFGMAMGPYRMSDLAGGDIGWAIRKRRYAEKPDARRFTVSDRLCEAGRFGQKTGGGWYDYAPGDRTPKPSAVTRQILETYWKEQGITPRQFSDEDIVARLMYALAHEGARILDEGIALRASDIDAVYLHGYGFPAWRGGPMFYSDTVGLFNVRRSMRGWAKEDSWWTPTTLLESRIEAGQRFND